VVEWESGEAVRGSWGREWSEGLWTCLPRDEEKEAGVGTCHTAVGEVLVGVLSGTCTSAGARLQLDRS
jgi:hypothetical protein